MLHTKQAINLNHSLSCRATDTLTLCTENTKNIRFFFFLHCICLSLCPPYPYQPLPSFCFAEVIWIWHGFVSSSLKRWNAEIPHLKIAQWFLAPLLECCSLGDGSMHSGPDAVAFPQGDGCCGVFKATEWHLHKKEWMLLGQGGKKRCGEGRAAQELSHHPQWCAVTVILPLLLWYRDRYFLCNICNFSWKRN